MSQFLREGGAGIFQVELVLVLHITLLSVPGVTSTEKVLLSFETGK